MLGHNVKNCATHFAVTQNGGMVDYQYGDFLRAMGARPRVDLPIEKQGVSENSLDDGGYKFDGLYRSDDGPYRSEANLQLNMAKMVEKR